VESFEKKMNHAQMLGNTKTELRLKKKQNNGNCIQTGESAFY